MSKSSGERSRLTSSVSDSEESEDDDEETEDALLLELSSSDEEDDKEDGNPSPFEPYFSSPLKSFVEKGGE